MGDLTENSNSSIQLDDVIRKIQDASLADTLFDHDFQEEVAKVLRVTCQLKSDLLIAEDQGDKVKQRRLEAVIPGLEVAACAVHKKPNRALVRDIRRDTEFVLRQIESPFWGRANNFFKTFLYSTETHTKVVVGLFGALPVHLITPIILVVLLGGATEWLKAHGVVAPRPTTPTPSASTSSQKAPENGPKQPEPAPSALASPQKASENVLKRLTEDEFSETVAFLIMSAMAGATGSVVSIMLRLDQYQNQKYRETLLPVFVGAFKPAIGAFLGIFVFALISSTLLPITVSKDESKPVNRWLAFMAIAFVVGFSERFANDLISQAEQIVPGKNPPGKSLSSSEDELIAHSEHKPKDTN
ncbi:hypothetical protein [Stenomitos frigidus]|uniref:Uncharacterized protein n=1 Tax=Stenomitos frigidus ULC18 TaxID=2107698 RepID=A0A2T1ELU7_9CYAN|nr:hypothetical protein [Stenomitos frigidus]PSB33730.1 hypothetical protein C7B82_04430 [Stenomitos frigidus ULC18]